MNNLAPERNRRILIVDDSRAIHDDFRKILAIPARRDELRSTEAELFDAPAELLAEPFELQSAYQGEEALEMVQKAFAAGKPYATVFMDIRMPPGWDGIETSQRILLVDPDIQIVICTAYSDYTWTDIIANVGKSDRLAILKKPFENVEARQLAEAMTGKWNQIAQARRQICDLTALLSAAVRDLHAANEAAELATRSRNDFLAKVATDVRTPLDNLIGTTHALLATNLDALQQEQAKEICRQAAAVLTVFNELEAVPRPLPAG